LATTACAVVIGLGDYEVGPDENDAGAEAGLDASVVVVPTNDSGTLDAGARPDASMPDDATTDAAPMDAASPDGSDADAEAGPTRDGIACKPTETCQGSAICCIFGSGNPACTALAICQGSLGRDFSCDDDSDCPGKVCCVDVGNADQKLKDSKCQLSCGSGQRHACVDQGDCGGTLDCVAPPVPLANGGLPLLKICR
jgi:hypothetical protein